MIDERNWERVDVQSLCSSHLEMDMFGWTESKYCPTYAWALFFRFSSLQALPVGDTLSVAALRSSLVVHDWLACVALVPCLDTLHRIHYSIVAAIVVGNDMLDPDSSRMECVDLDSLLAFAMADCTDCNPPELAVLAYHKAAGHCDDPAENLDASSLVPHDWDLGSPNAVVMKGAGDMLGLDLVNTWACVDTAAEAHSCTDHLTAGESSVELPFGAFAHA